jgi:hypothetical protein
VQPPRAVESAIKPHELPYERQNAAGHTRLSMDGEWRSDQRSSPRIEQARALDAYREVDGQVEDCVRFFRVVGPIGQPQVDKLGRSL